MLPMPDLIQSHLSQSEESLIDAIRRQPQLRSNYVALADYLEKTGSIEESRTVYRGNLPRSIQERHGLNPYRHGSSLDMASCHRLDWYGQEKYWLAPPLNDDPHRNSAFLEKQIKTGTEYLDVMQNCTLIYDGRNRLYIDQDGVMNSDHSTMNAFLLGPRATQTDKATHLPGLSILLAARNSHNFYHWHYDCLPALGLVQSAGIPLTEIDHILIDDRDRGFQVQTLTAAGIRPEQIRFIDVEDSHLTCDQMLMARIRNQQGMAQSRRHLDWARRTFLPSLDSRTTGEQQRFPSRLAIKRDVRGFTDPETAYGILEDKGYTCVQLENHSYLDQVAMFANATHIVSPHGAGLSLLAFARHGTAVHEFHGDHVQPCFWSISSALGLRYHNYNCSGITDKEVTSSNKNLAERLVASIKVSQELLRSIPE